MAWSDAQDHALRVAINRCNPTRPLGPNAQEPLRKKWEEVARSEGVPHGCSAQAAFERAVELGWSSYPPQHKAKTPHLGPSGSGQRALGSLPAAPPGGGASAAAAAAAAARCAPHKPQHRSHPAAYHLPRAAAGSGSSGGGGGGGGSSSSSGGGGGGAAPAKAPSAGLKRREPPQAQPSERREAPQTLPSERGSSSSGGGGGGSGSGSGSSSSRSTRYKPGAAEAMQHLCDGLKEEKYDEAAFASMYSAALDHFAPLAAR